MRKLLSVVIVILWAMPPFAAAAPAGEAPLTLDMAGAVSLALKKNHEAAALREELRGVREAAELSGTLANPILELEGASGALTNSPDEKSIGIALAQEIPLSQVGARRRELARAEAAVLLARLRDYERGLSEEVRRTWIDAALAARRHELARGQQALSAELLTLTKLRLQAGDLAEMDALLAEADSRRSGLALLENAAAEKTARRRLALLIGLEDAAALPPLAEAQAPSTDAFPAGEEPPPGALAGRPGLMAQRLEEEREKAALALAQAEAVPVLTAALSYREERSAQNSYDLIGAQLVGQTEQTRDRIMGLKLSLPLPLFSRNQAETVKAEARLHAARQRLLGLTRTAESELRELMAGRQLAIAALALHRATLGPLARENYRIRQEAFALGELGMPALLDEKRRLGEQQEAELAALQAALEADNRLTAATGQENNQKNTAAKGGSQ